MTSYSPLMAPSCLTGHSVVNPGGPGSSHPRVGWSRVGIMSTRTASARWQGTLKEGTGVLRTGKGGYEGPYSFASRFEEGEGTNPEELIGAAHAACYSMALSGILTTAGS